MKLIFQPEKWHACHEDDYLDCDDAVNCYSYVLNRPDFYWSVPGMGFAREKTQRYFDSFNSFFESYSLETFCEALIAGAVRDGFIQTEAMVAREGYYLSALVFPEDIKDFHWYRQDDNGTWSHKNGWRVATQHDDDGQEIIDPRKAKDSFCSVFGSFFLVPRTGIELMQTFPILE